MSVPRALGKPRSRNETNIDGVSAYMRSWLLGREAQQRFLSRRLLALLETRGLRICQEPDLDTSFYSSRLSCVFCA